jgi:predicted enzyme related to lactoylglutathione lyase
MSRVVHFEISADDGDRARTFYENVFGWQFHKWDGPEPYWLVATGPDEQPGINGGMFLRKGQVGHVNTVAVESIDTALESVKGSGGEVVVEKHAVPGIGWHAYCKDTEGSIFGIMQNDPSAA